MTDETPHTFRKRRGTHEEFFWGENLMDKYPLKRLRVEGRISFKWIIEKLRVNRWSGLNWT